MHVYTLICKNAHSIDLFLQKIQETALDRFNDVKRDYIFLTNKQHTGFNLNCNLFSTIKFCAFSSFRLVHKKEYSRPYTLMIALLS